MKQANKNKCPSETELLMRCQFWPSTITSLHSSPPLRSSDKWHFHNPLHKTSLLKDICTSKGQPCEGKEEEKKNLRMSF
uniref:Uncharacterized protein n=1 Tax=Anguilla anguilla TaxID=7936 RepID=A0A0E9RK20_ANGAN